jgi:hypothetical protein
MKRILHYAQRVTSTLKRHEDTTYLAYAILCTLLIAALALPALYARPIADDFHYFNDIADHNIVSYLVYFYTQSTGRLAQGASVAVLYKFFGAAAVTIGPLIEILLLSIVSSWLVYLFLSTNRVATRKITKSLIIGIASTFLIVVYPVSIFDSLYWLTSSTVYILSLIGALFNFGLIWHFVQLKKMQWWHFVVLTISIIVCQSFSEATSAVVIILIGISLFVSIYQAVRRQANNPNTTPLLATSFIAAIVGFLLVYLSPGSRQRQATTGSQFHLHSMLVEPVSHTVAFIQTLFSWQLMIAIGIGMTLAFFLRRLPRNKVITLAITGAGLVVIPAYITFVIATYSMGDYTPLRLYSIPAAFAYIGLTLIATACWQYFQRISSVNICGFTPIISCSLILISYFGTLPMMQDITSAQALRASLYDAREASIIHQRAAAVNTIHVTPAPIILNQSEAGDLSFKDGQVSWFVDSFKHYYKIGGKDLKLSNTQPTGYCMSTQAPTWYGIQTCSNENQ